MLILSLGVAYSGNINFFFGLDENVCWRFKRIQDFEGQIFVMNHDMPMIGETISKRIHNNSTSSKVSQLNPGILDNISAQVNRFDHVEKTNKLVFGDSHCFSAYRPGYMVCRNDGLTLYSSLKNGIKKTIEERSGIDIEEIDHLTFYMGNIDIRHHLMRQENPFDRCYSMVRELGYQLRGLEIDNIEIVQALPVECESRKLPKTGYYKGTPFYGSWEERSKLCNTFNMALDRISIEDNFNIFRWPACFLNDKKQLDFNYMERPKSVHLSPLSYRWDLNQNTVNEIHK